MANIGKAPVNGLLGRQIAMLPTCRAQDSYERSNWKTIVRAEKGEAQMTPSRKLKCKDGQKTGLKLQPAFVEWMMGYPEGWTELTD